MAQHTRAGGTSTAIQFNHQSEKLSLQAHDATDGASTGAMAVEARFITPQDPVIETQNGARLPAVPLNEALELNRLRDQVDGQSSESGHQRRDPAHLKYEESVEESSQAESTQSARPDASLRNAIPPSRTHPLFPEMPLYGPPSLLRDIQCIGFRVSSAILSLAFLAVIVLGSAFTSIPLMFRHIVLRLTFRNPDARRPFYEEEKRRQQIRNEEAKEWKCKRRQGWGSSNTQDANNEEDVGQEEEEFEPTEGGKDPLICDLGYYARRVGLDAETYEVMTEDGFIVQLVHIYNPKEREPASPSQRAHGAPVVFPKPFDHDRSSISSSATSSSSSNNALTKCKYPVLLMHGLLQSSGAYCVNDDSSLAFYLCKSGYDVWLGNNRCGFNPQHQLLTSTDPRMWNWNIRQMGVMDLPAFVSRVLSETGFSKLGLICHSQGTTETFVALAKEQRPDLGEKISVFCALAPAVYAGPLIGKMYLKFMRIISPGMFRVMFGIHSFIPFMMTMHSYLPGRLYSALGYRVFSFLFNWTDDRWDQGLRNRFFQFSPVYVSAESMRWWLGRECFASQKCILATREEGRIEDEEDEGDNYYTHSTEHSTERMLDGQHHPNQSHCDRSSKAWFDERVPPFALWVAGSDELVDGRRLLRRFERGREPHVRVVHSKIIEEYEHLDVLWAIDSVEKVAKEVREVLWKTVPENVRARCRVPKGCEGVSIWEDPKRIAKEPAGK